MWTSFRDLEDATLKRLAADLPATVLQCKATSTTKKYTGAYKRWKEWAVVHNLPVFPVNDGHAALYLQHLAETKCSKSVVEEAAIWACMGTLDGRATIPNGLPYSTSNFGGPQKEAG